MVVQKQSWIQSLTGQDVGYSEKLFERFLNNPEFWFDRRGSAILKL